MTRQHDHNTRQNASQLFVRNYVDDEIEQSKANILDEIKIRIKEYSEEINISNNFLKDENKKLTSKIKSLVKDNKENILDIEFLKDRIYDLESSVFEQQQRSRRNNIELHGLPNIILDETLEKTIVDIFNENNLVDQGINISDIEACHRLPAKNGRTKPVIIRFLCRKIRDEIFINREHLVNIDLSKYDIDQVTTIYINNNLSPQFKKMTFMCRELKQEGLVTKYIIDNSKLKIKIEGGGRWTKIMHDEQLYNLFPDYYGDADD